MPDGPNKALPNLPNARPRDLPYSFRVADLSCGLGTVSLAARNLGMETVFATENNERARELYKENFGFLPLEGVTRGDITKASEIDILCLTLRDLPDSVASITDDGLVALAFQLADARKPFGIVLEAPIEITHFKEGQILSAIYKELRDMGYEAQDSRNHEGDAYKRERLYIVAQNGSSRMRVFPWSEVTQTNTFYMRVDISTFRTGFPSGWRYPEQDEAEQLRSLESPLSLIQNILSKLQEIGGTPQNRRAIRNFWDEFLENPPMEITSAFFSRHEVNPDDYHCVRWVGFEGDFEIDELWQFGRSGMRGKGRMPPQRSFPQYGGETLCGLEIKSGAGMYGPRWRSIEPSRNYEPPNEDNLQLALIDLHGITCMVCRKILVYGMSRVIEDLTFLRSNLVGDWSGEEYISKEPLVHGKRVISFERKNGIQSEAYQYRCASARKSPNPQLVDDAKESQRITCPDCLENLAAGIIP